MPFFSLTIDLILFQVLLKPIVSQLVVEPPKSLEQAQEVPSMEEVDESLVLCLGQMAITSRSDVLWKPLNHEVSTDFSLHLVSCL